MTESRQQPDKRGTHPTMTPTLTLNNGVTMPALGLGVFQTPPEETTDGRRDGAARRLPADRHRRRVRQRARGRRGHPPLGRRPRGGVHRDQGLDQRLRLRRHPARLRQERRQARRRPARPADPAPAAAEPLRSDARRLPGAGEAARRRQGARDRRQQLHARAPRAAAARDDRRARGQPDRAAPLLPAARAAARARASTAS